jgi:hypothetical protein
MAGSVNDAVRQPPAVSRSQLASVRLHNGGTNRKAQPETMMLSREKWLQNRVFFDAIPRPRSEMKA